MKILAIAIALSVASALNGAAAAAVSALDLTFFANASGIQATWRSGGLPRDFTTGAFFQPLTSRRRSCGSCHRPAQGWAISASEVKDRFEATRGLDPIFSTNDGSNC